MRSYWCGNSARTGVLLVAYIDSGIGVFHFLAGLLVVAYPELFFEEADTRSLLFPIHNLPEFGTVSASITLVILVTLLVFVAEVALASLLISGATERNGDKCDIWIKIRSFLLLVGIVGFIYDMATLGLANRDDLYLLAGVLLIGVLYRLYTLLIVKSFHYELFASNGYDLGLGLLTGERRL